MRFKFKPIAKIVSQTVISGVCSQLPRPVCPLDGEYDIVIRLRHTITLELIIKKVKMKAPEKRKATKHLPITKYKIARDGLWWNTVGPGIFLVHFVF